MPPALRDGWSYIVNPDDWLLVEGPVGSLFFVAVAEGDYFLLPRCVAGPGNPYHKEGAVYIDTEKPMLLPVAEPFEGRVS